MEEVIGVTLGRAVMALAPAAKAGEGAILRRGTSPGSKPTRAPLRRRLKTHLPIKSNLETQSRKGALRKRMLLMNSGARKLVLM